jgi:hypothetical protein
MNVGDIMEKYLGEEPGRYMDVESPARAPSGSDGLDEAMTWSKLY